MLTVISPAKTLDFESQGITTKSSKAQFPERTQRLVATLRKQSPKQLEKLMGISPTLAQLNARRFREWCNEADIHNSRQAILAFKGDVYLGLAVENYNQRDFNFAQKNLRILSGLYGVLRPLDLIQPYRLEMGTKICPEQVKNLYEFWTDDITNGLCADLGKHRNKSLINLTSKEYFRSINPELLPGKVITPVFKDLSNGTYRVLSFFAKKARGHMATFIVKNRINKPDDIKSFNVDGYQYNEDLSKEYDWVFTRRAG